MSVDDITKSRALNYSRFCKFQTNMHEHELASSNFLLMCVSFSVVYRKLQMSCLTYFISMHEYRLISWTNFLNRWIDSNASSTITDKTNFRKLKNLWLGKESENETHYLDYEATIKFKQWNSKYKNTIWFIIMYPRCMNCYA